MADNKRSEVDLLKDVASAARWAIDSNGDDPVRRDGRARVGVNWVMANSALARALNALAEQYGLDDRHGDGRQQAREMHESLYGKPSSDDELPLFGDEDEEAEASNDTLAGDPA